MQTIFRDATRLKLRFPYKGLISTEDLWDLDENQLDSIYRELSAKQRELVGDGLINSTSTESDTLTLQMKVIEEVFGYKRMVAEDARNASGKKAKRQKVLAALAAKKDEELMNKSVEELEAMLEEE